MNENETAEGGYGSLSSFNETREKKISKRNIFYIMIIVFVLLAFLAICFFSFFRVRSISVAGNLKYSEDDIVTVSGIKKGGNIFGFSVDSSIERIKDAYPYIVNVEVTRNMPSGIVITVTEEKPVMYTAVGSDIYLLSKDLDVLERFGSSAQITMDEPLIFLNYGANLIKSCIVGKKMTFFDERTRDNTSELYGNMITAELDKNVFLVDIPSRFDVTLHYGEKFDIYIGSIKDSDIKFSFLQGIFEKLYSDAKGKIDISQTKRATFSPKK